MLVLRGEHGIVFIRATRVSLPGMSNALHARPAADEYPTYYTTYVNLAPPGDLIEALEEQGRALARSWEELPAAAHGFRYADGKWSVEEVVGHVIDIERTFAYRAMCALRGLTDMQPSVDQDIMAPNSGADERGLKSLGAEFLHLRLSNVELFRHLTEAQSQLRGRASGGEFTVRALACILYGHAVHHATVLDERYASSWG